MKQINTSHWDKMYEPVSTELAGTIISKKRNTFNDQSDYAFIVEEGKLVTPKSTIPVFKIETYRLGLSQIILADKVNIIC